MGEKDSEREQEREMVMKSGKGKKRMEEGREEYERRNSSICLVCLSVCSSVLSQLPQWWNSELQPCQSRPRDSVPPNGCQTPAGPTYQRDGHSFTEDEGNHLHNSKPVISTFLKLK